MSAAATGFDAVGVKLNPEDRAELLKIHGEFKETHERVKSELKAFGDTSGETKTKLGKLSEAVQDMAAKYDESTKRFDTIERKLNDKVAELTPAKTFGEQVISDAGLIQFAKSSGRGGVVVVVKGPINELRTKDIVGLSVQMPENVGVSGGARLPFGVRALVPQAKTTAGAVRFIKETGFTNNARPVAEATAKPKSDKTFLPITAPVEVIAHYFKISKQTFDDLPVLAGMVENNGIYGVKIAEEDQLLNGDGTSPNLQGFLEIANTAPAPTGTGANLIDAIGMAFFDLASKGWLPDGVALNPADWGGVALMKNAQGNYLFANPLAYTSGGTVWGMRMALSAKMPPTEFLVGAFRGNSQIFDREEVNVQVANQNEDDFIKNMYTVLVEERLVLCIYQPSAFEKGTVPVVIP